MNLIRTRGPIDAFLGEGKPSPRPPPKSASRRNEPHSYSMPFLARSALGRGSGGGLALPQESINLKKSPSDLEILLSYDRAHTVFNRYFNFFVAPHQLANRMSRLLMPAITARIMSSSNAGPTTAAISSGLLCTETSLIVLMTAFWQSVQWA